MTKDYDSRVELSDGEWSEVMVCLRYKASHDDMRAMDTKNSPRIAVAFRMQAKQARELANRIEENY